MKLTKYILPIVALLMVFAVVESNAQICVFQPGEKYLLEDAIEKKGDNVEFIKWCCEELGKCTPGYLARDHYYLTHIAAMYKREAVLKYLVEEKNIPKDSFPGFVEPGDKVEYRTQVMMSAVRGDYASTKYLVDAGASVTRKDPDGHDALYFAKQSGNQKVINYVQSAWNKAKGYSYNQIEKEKIKLKNLLKPEAIQKQFAENKTLQTTKPFLQENNLI